MTTEKTLREHLQAAGRARWENKTAEERKAHASNMARARWDKAKPLTAKEDENPSKG